MPSGSRVRPGIVAGNQRSFAELSFATIAQGYLEEGNRDVDGKIILQVDKLPLTEWAGMPPCDAKTGVRTVLSTSLHHARFRSRGNLRRRSRSHPVLSAAQISV